MLNSKEKKWLIGISSENIPMFDIEKPYLQDALALAFFLKEKYDKEVGIFKTDKGFHVILKTVLDKKEFLNLYDQALKFAIETGIHIDPLHLELTKKYERTTIRITKKPFNPASSPPRLLLIV